MYKLYRFDYKFDLMQVQQFPDFLWKEPELDIKEEPLNRSRSLPFLFNI